MRVYPAQRRNEIPTAPIAKIVRQWLDGQPNLDLHGNEWNGDRWYGPSRVLAERAGIPPDSLIAVLSVRRKTMDFNKADKLLCACGLNHLWQTTLKSLYDGVRLVDKQEPVA